MAGGGRCILEVSPLPPIDIDTAHTGLHIEWILQVQYPERRLDQMAPQISQCAGAVVPPAPPAARDHLVRIVAPGGGSQPEIPIEFSGNRGFGGPLYTLRPDRTICPDLDGVDISDNAGVIPLLQLSDPISGGPLITHLGHHLIDRKSTRLNSSHVAS